MALQNNPLWHCHGVGVKTHTPFPHSLASLSGLHAEMTLDSEGSPPAAEGPYAELRGKFLKAKLKGPAGPPCSCHPASGTQRGPRPQPQLSKVGRRGSPVAPKSHGGPITLSTLSGRGKEEEVGGKLLSMHAHLLPSRGWHVGCSGGLPRAFAVCAGRSLGSVPPPATQGTVSPSLPPLPWPARLSSPSRPPCSWTALPAAQPG